MNLRSALRKSELIAPAENALRRADTRFELQEAWFDFCESFAEGSEERTHLLELYNKRCEAFRLADRVARLLRV